MAMVTARVGSEPERDDNSADVAPRRISMHSSSTRAELRLRGLEPPYDAVKQKLFTRFAGMDEATQRKAGKKFAREIGMFRRENDKPLH
jgi:hypothetical protein